MLETEGVPESEGGVFLWSGLMQLYIMCIFHIAVSANSSNLTVRYTF